jgi:hypothetical protein
MSPDGTPIPPRDERAPDWTMESAPIEPDLKSRSSHPTLTASLLMVGIALAIVLIAAAGVLS